MLDRGDAGLAWRQQTDVRLEIGAFGRCGLGDPMKLRARQRLGKLVLHFANRSALRARAFAASSSRFFDGALVLSERNSRSEAAVISSTAA